MCQCRFLIGATRHLLVRWQRCELVWLRDREIQMYHYSNPKSSVKIVYQHCEHASITYDSSVSACMFQAE